VAVSFLNLPKDGDLRIISGGRWTLDGRWVVIGPMYGTTMIVYDPGNGDPWTDIQDCLRFVRENDENR
jgi:hypothetical protein